jgi:hypothetical protein
LSRS